MALQADGVVGGDDTLGGDLVFSGLYDKISFSAGQYHYETDGFRENNDQDLDIYNVFAQASLSPKTSIQAEYRYSDTEKGDLSLRFDPDNFFPTLREEEIKRSVRLGFHHKFTPHSDLIASIIYVEKDIDNTLDAQIPLPPPPFGPGPINMQLGLDGSTDGYIAEVQHLFRSDRVHVTSGIGHFNADKDQTRYTNFQPEIPPLFQNDSKIDSRDIDHTNLYVYSLINYPKSATWTIGSSVDFFDDEKVDHDKVNPKLGVSWNLFPDTTLRAAAFRTLKRTLISNQTLEPTQVAGFNQFFDDIDGTEAWRYGIAIDQKFSKELYGGVEFSRRDMDVSFTNLSSGQVEETDEIEQLARTYLYWTPHRWLALSAEYQFERFDTDPDAPRDEMVEIKTHRLPLKISFFHPLGFNAWMKATHVNQRGEFGNSSAGIVRGDDQFWVVDASIGYRFPKRWGLITLEARNLFDEEFKFQDTDPANPRIYPDRLILAKFTLSF